MVLEYSSPLAHKTKDIHFLFVLKQITAHSVQLINKCNSGLRCVLSGSSNLKVKGSPGLGELAQEVIMEATPQDVLSK